MGILRKSLLITIILLGLVSHGLAVTPKVIPSTDITYLGAFRLPSAPSGYSWNTGTSGGDWDVGLEYLPTFSLHICWCCHNVLVIIVCPKMY